MWQTLAESNLHITCNCSRVNMFRELFFRFFYNCDKQQKEATSSVNRVFPTQLTQYIYIDNCRSIKPKWSQNYNYVSHCINYLTLFARKTRFHFIEPLRACVDWCTPQSSVTQVYNATRSNFNLRSMYLQLQTVERIFAWKLNLLNWPTMKYYGVKLWEWNLYLY